MPQGKQSDGGEQLSDDKNEVSKDDESDLDNEGRIQVVCRIRKMSEMELSAPERCKISYGVRNLNYVMIRKNKVLENFKFKRVFN